MKLRLRLTVTMTFATLAVIAITVVAGVNFLGGRETIHRIAATKIDETSDYAQRRVEQLVRQMVSLADVMARLPADLYDRESPDALLGSLTVALQNSPQIYGVFVGYPDGGFVQSVNLENALRRDPGVAAAPIGTHTAWRVLGAVSAGGSRATIWRYFDKNGTERPRSPTEAKVQSVYDPRTRPWFIADPENEKTQVTRPYIFESLAAPGVTVSKAIQTVPGATLGIDLSLADLTALSQRLRPGPNGAFLILDDQTRVLADSRWSGDDPESRYLTPVADLQDPLIDVARQAVTRGKEQRVTFDLDGVSYIATQKMTAGIGDKHWQLWSIARIDDFTLGLLDTLYQSLIITLPILVLAICAVAWMAGWISKPVVRLQKMATQVTALDLSAVNSFPSPFDEVKRLQTAMEKMRLTLDTFLRFVPRDVVRDLIRAGGVAEVGGVTRPVTLLFTDVENFTAITEKMTPEQIMKQVSAYFDRLSLGIQAHRGTIDKFIGDAVMAVWNAPLDDTDHVDNACRATLACRQLSEELNQEFAETGLPPMWTRFGLNTCNVLVGNVGAPDRMQYTCLGSGVNLAARIEGLNKFYGTQILASDTVRRKASREFLFRRVDLVLAKGTTRPLPIYELMGEQAADSPYFVGAEAVQRAINYEQAFDFYLHQDFKDALVILEKLIDQHPGDQVVEQLADRCRGYVAEPPAHDWNGARLLDEK